MAEQSDLICELDRWVLRAAVDQLGSWRADAGLSPDEGGVRVAVNLSARTLSDPRITDTVLSTLAYAGVPAACLVLEVTESAVLESPVLLTQLAALRATGVSIALDDFGTGTTSIGALRHLPVDTLKVDGAFISADPADQQLVALMVATAHAQRADRGRRGRRARRRAGAAGRRRLRRRAGLPPLGPAAGGRGGRAVRRRGPGRLNAARARPPRGPGPRRAVQAAVRSLAAGAVEPPSARSTTSPSTSDSQASSAPPTSEIAVAQNRPPLPKKHAAPMNAPG